MDIFVLVTDEDLISLYSLFGETLEKALEIVEENKVTYYYIQRNNIGVYQVPKLLKHLVQFNGLLFDK